MKNKTILVTGATQGIGKTTALLLAKQGHHVIIHGRNESKLQEVKKELQRESGNSNIDSVTADLLSMADTKRMAEELNARYDHLDVLINNAGAIFGQERETTKDGYEKTFMLNVLSPLLLMHLLLGLLMKSSSGRIVNLSSATHRRAGKPDFTDFQLEKGYNVMRSYATSKLYVIWLSRHFAKQLKTQGVNNVTVNVCHPGAVATNFGQDVDKGFIFNMIFKVALLFMDKPEDGAMSTVYLATSPEVNNVTGEFFSNRKTIEKPDDKYYSVENEQKVWDYSMSAIKPYL